MTQTATGAFDSSFGGNAGPVDAGSEQSSQRTSGCCGWKSGSHSRMRWSALEIGAMVGGFIVFWPLGLLALFLKWKNKEMWPGAADGTLPFSGLFSKKPSMPGSFKGFGFGGFSGPSSGNSAFDAYKRQQLERLEEERRKLEDEQHEFHAYMKRLAEARDKEEFDRFMAERNAAKPAGE